MPWVFHGNKKSYGGIKMKEALIRIEIERIVNLVAGFGWKKTEEKVEADKVSMTLTKEVAPTVEE